MDDNGISRPGQHLFKTPHGPIFQSLGRLLAAQLIAFFNLHPETYYITG